MFVHLSLLLFIFLLLPLAFSNSISKPGCPNACGNLSIPYPFGVGSGCSLDPSFDIKCNTSSTNSPKAYLSIMDKEVIEINRTFIRVKYPNVVSVCYEGGNATAEAEHKILVNLTGTRYTVSLDNWLTVIGCDDMVLQFTQSNGSGSNGGCSAFCADKNDADGFGHCAASTANGCCQTRFYGDYLGLEFIDLAPKLRRRKLFPCSHAFIQEHSLGSKTIFSYPLYYHHNSTALLNDNWASASQTPVVVLDWVAGNENCSTTVSNSTTSACRADKSVCVDSDPYLSGGYLCECVEGYEGNPYLPGGCKSIPSHSSNPIARSDCQNQCGKLLFSFPFGVGKNCYLEPSFEILCDTTTNLHTAYLAILKAEIVELNSTKVSVKYPHVASSCYNLSDGIPKKRKQGLVIDLLETQYTISDSNWIHAIGCNDMLVVATGEKTPTSIHGSCAPICSDSTNSYASCVYDPTSSATGNGCCETQIPRGTTYLEANFTELSGPWSHSNFSCSYAFVQYIEILYDGSYAYDYPILDNASTTDDILSRAYANPNLELDWRIGAVNCEARRNLTTFACRDNSDCVDFDVTVGGYLCNCSKGYRGNPYIDRGCKDIDECADNATNPCVFDYTCGNDIGTYHCSCPEGYIGDGKKGGTGCSHRPPSKSKMRIVIGNASGLGCLLLLLMLFWMYKLLQKRKEKMLKEKFFKRNGGLLLQQHTNESTLAKPKVFPTKELEVATDHFNESRILGQGGQGTVYKGMLSDGKIVAVKKSKLVEEKHLEQFINEVVILSQINHRNVVRLLGCCLETEVPLLVYEFMSNGTLFDLLHDPNNEFLIPWNMRLKMAADIAGALAYLHSASSIPIYHRDIKSSNILLDERNVVKVSDFGTSMSMAVDQTHLTTMVRGTFGYLDPEYFQSSQFTEKSDVYSFGVVLVELLTRKRPISYDDIDEERGLAARFRTCMEENCLDTILDRQVLEQSRKEEVILVARLAQRCLNLKGKMRPTMKEVATELESFRISQMPCSVVRDEIKEVRSFEAKTTTFTDSEYTWSASYNNISSSPSASHPLMFRKE